MHFSPSQALLGLFATLDASALGAPPADGTHNTYGTNSTTNITPSLVTRSSAAQVAYLSNLACYAPMQGCKYRHVYKENAKQAVTDMCKKQKGVVGRPGWPGTEAHLRIDYWMSFNMKVEWKEGCTAPGDGTMDVFNPGPELGLGCSDVLWITWPTCDNGGRGGKIDYGCLTYHYNVINGDHAGRGYCVNRPFDNSSLGGDEY